MNNTQTTATKSTAGRSRYTWKDFYKDPEIDTWWGRELQKSNARHLAAIANQHSRGYQKPSERLWAALDFASDAAERFCGNSEGWMPAQRAGTTYWVARAVQTDVLEVKVIGGTLFARVTA